MSKYLGINFGHDAGISVIDNSSIHTVLSERVNGFKQSAEINETVLDKALTVSNSDLEDINFIGITSTQGRGIPYSEKTIFRPNKIYRQDDKEFVLFGNLSSMFKSRKWHFLKNNEKWQLMPYPARSNIILKEFYGSKITQVRDLKLELNDLIHCLTDTNRFKNNELFFIDHHLAHTFSGMTKLENYNNCLVISIDGANHGYEESYPITFSGLVTKIYNETIELINPALFYGGAFYSLMSHSIGLTEGKLMGLSAYATSNLSEIEIKKYLQIIESKKLRSEFDKISLELSELSTVSFHDEDDCLVSFDKRDMPKKSMIAVAANTQKIFEYYYLDFIQNLINKFKPKDIVLVGGCSLNCPSNSKLQNNNKQINIIVDNSCNDEGLSNGAAQAVRFIKETKLPIHNSSPYLGEPVENISGLLKSIKNRPDLILIKRSLNSLSNEIVECLKKNKIGFVMRGRYEIGPRALLNRSIIGRSDSKENHLIVNLIKNREPWRPLAPFTNDEFYDEFFDGPKNKYMLMTQHVRDKKRIPAVSHIDGSARCQLINDELFDQVLKKLNMELITPVLINTSFNGKDEPIINDALRAFQLFEQFNDVGFLLINDFIIKKIA